MSSVNKAIIIGNLGQDPTIRYMPDGNAVANISVATSETWKDKNTGEKKERTEWHRVTFYGKLAEIVAQYLTKGSKVYVEGKLQTRKWTDKDGIERYTTEIIAHEMRMLSTKRDDSGAGDQPTPEQRQNRAAATAQAEKREPGSYGPAGGFADMDDDLPF